MWLSTDPELTQQSVVELQKLYAQGGFAMDEDFRDLPDHVAVELEFLCLLNLQLNRSSRSCSCASKGSGRTA